MSQIAYCVYRKKMSSSIYLWNNEQWYRSVVFGSCYLIRTHQIAVGYNKQIEPIGIN